MGECVLAVWSQCLLWTAWASIRRWRSPVDWPQSPCQHKEKYIQFYTYQNRFYICIFLVFFFIVLNTFRSWRLKLRIMLSNIPQKYWQRTQKLKDLWWLSPWLCWVIAQIFVKNGVRSANWTTLCKWSWLTFVTGNIYIGSFSEIWKSGCGSLFHNFFWN